MKIGINSSFIVTHFDDLLKPNFYIDKINYNFGFYDNYRLKFETDCLNKFDLSDKVASFINNTNKSLNKIDAELSDKKYYEIDEKHNEINENFNNAYDLIKKVKNYNFVITNGFLKISDDIFVDRNLTKIFIYLLDLFLGTASLFIDDDASQIIRRLYYKCGDYSKYNNTVEYKLLSNNWLFDFNKINLIFQIVEFCLNFIKNESYKKFYDIENDYVYIHGYDFVDYINIINQLKINKAERYLRFIFNFLPENICNEIEKIKAS